MGQSGSSIVGQICSYRAVSAQTLSRKVADTLRLRLSPVYSRHEHITHRAHDGSSMAGLATPVPIAEQVMEVWRTGADLVPEDATEEELTLVEAFREVLLQKKGRDSSPEDWRSVFYKKATLLRFLRARELKVDAATDMILSAMTWFESEKMALRMPGTFLDIIRQAELEDSPEDRELYRKHRPHGLFGFDKRGAKVQYFRYGGFDDASLEKRFKGLDADRAYFEQSGGEEEQNWNSAWPKGPGHRVWVRQFLLKNMEDVVTLSKEQLKHDKAFMGVIQVWDLRGIQIGRARTNWPFMQYMLAGFRILDNFPEATKTIYLVNAPWFIKLIISILGNFLPPTTRDKLRCFSDQAAWLEAMTKDIDLDQIPDFIGGTSREVWPYGVGVLYGDDAEENEGAIELHISTEENVSKRLRKQETSIFQFRLKENSSDEIDYAVYARGGGKDVEIVPKSRLALNDGWTAPIQISAFDDVDETEVVVVFDNSFSWFAHKDVLYRFTIESPGGKQ